MLAACCLRQYFTGYFVLRTSYSVPCYCWQAGRSVGATACFLSRRLQLGQFGPVLDLPADVAAWFARLHPHVL